MIYLSFKICFSLKYSNLWRLLVTFRPITNLGAAIYCLPSSNRIIWKHTHSTHQNLYIISTHISIPITHTHTCACCTREPATITPRNVPQTMQTSQLLKFIGSVFGERRKWKIIERVNKHCAVKVFVCAGEWTKHLKEVYPLYSLDSWMYTTNEELHYIHCFAPQLEFRMQMTQARAVPWNWLFVVRYGAELQTGLPTGYLAPQQSKRCSLYDGVIL